MHGYQRFELGAWKRNERLPCLCAYCKKTYLTDFVYIQPQYIRLDGLICGIFLGFFRTFLEGSVDHIIYGDYIMNRRFFFFFWCCSLACETSKAVSTLIIHTITLSGYDCHNARVADVYNSDYTQHFVLI